MLKAKFFFLCLIYCTCSQAALNIKNSMVGGERATEHFNLDSNVSFSFKGTSLSEDGKQELSKLIESTSNLKNVSYEIYGYTDSLGDQNFNLSLSERRAQSVANVLMELGATRIDAIKGLGSSNPLSGESCNELKQKEKLDCLAQDRRVEIIIHYDKYVD